MVCGVVLGHARSGSTGLARAISASTGVEFRMEPFHRPMRNRGIDFESSGFEEYLDSVMSRRLIKHMWNGLTLEQNARVLSHPNVAGVVFIFRRDAVQAALSAEVARMTGKWAEAAPEIPEPLPLHRIDKQARLYSEGQAIYKEWLANSNIPHLVLAYEDVYRRHDQSDLVAEVCHLLGFSKFDASAGAAELLPQKRYHSDKFFRSAPNWLEFEKRFLR